KYVSCVTPCPQIDFSEGVTTMLTLRDLLKHLAVWQLQMSNKKSKGGPNGGRKKLSAHPMKL
ncbi:hypothetical protein, partial [Tatumella sp. JGM130]|uniref:hypothetical protein n=1 Tax=Tatumella sp. JGM130 TaxID=2799797 RepID=UPI001BAE9580